MIADSLGRIKLPTPTHSKYKVVFIGYETENIKLDKSHASKTITITLNEVVQWLGEVIITPINKTKPIKESPKKLKPLK